MIDGSGLPASRSYTWYPRIACVVALLSVVTVDVVGAQSSNSSRALDRLRSAQRAAATNTNSSAAYRDIRALIDGPAIQDLDAERRHEALDVAVRLALDLERIADANAMLRRASGDERSTESSWYGRFRTGIEIEDYSDAIFALREYMARFPGKVATVYPPSIYGALRQMRNNDRADAATEVLNVLFASGWRVEAGQEPSGAWRDLALARLAGNDLAGAAEVSARITSPEILIAMRVDKRFDAIVAALPARFDVARAVDEEIESLRKAVAATPNQLESVNLLAFALHGAGRLDEGLALVEAVLDRVTDSNRVSPYTDGREQVVWLRNARSTILWTMGRHADAADELKKASDVEGNVSQRINYAGQLVRLGRGAEALPLLRDLDANLYGSMQAAMLEVAAAKQTGNERVASRALKYLETHESDAIAALESAFLSVRDFESAAGIFIKRLQSPQERGDALLAAQNYLDEPKTPYESRRDADFAALLARPDVMGALEAVGRIESHPIHAR